jgi:hypothetical protein
MWLEIDWVFMHESFFCEMETWGDCTQDCGKLYRVRWAKLVRWLFWWELDDFDNGPRKDGGTAICASCSEGEGSLRRKMVIMENEAISILLYSTVRVNLWRDLI